MTPPPAATIAGRGAAPARGRSAPKRPATRSARAPRAHAGATTRQSVALPRPFALPLRLPRVSLRAIPAALPLGRLFNGRGAIALLGAALLFLVFLQVSLLKLNTAISVNVERAAQLERDNAQARATVSKLDAGRRIQDAAGQLGMVMPAAGSICFLTAGHKRACAGGDVSQAGEGLDPADDVAQPVAVAAQSEPSAASVPVQQPGAQTPAPTSQAAPAPVAGQAPVAQQQQQQQPAPVQQTAPAQQPAPVQADPQVATPSPAAQAGATGGLAATTGAGG